ncbi:MAG TPA: hypothetical protein VH643_39265 [Gemmataceae bacterium]
MKHVSRLLLTVFVLTILGVGMMRVLASRDQHGGQSLAHWYLLEIRRSAALDSRASEMSQSLEVKKAVIADLLAKRVSLREAAEQFREADQQIDNDGVGLVAPYRMPESEAGLYRQVIAWTKAELSDDPKQTEQIIPRLEQEMVEDCRDEGSAE